LTKKQHEFSAFVNKLGMYVHVPFCLKKCFYCDFYSVPYSKTKTQTYIKYLEREIQEFKKLIANRKVNTLYLGGGTPNSITEEDFQKIYQNIYDNFNLDLQEFTVEINPGAGLSPEFLKNIGVNRISIGIQSLNNKSLNSIGRVHNADDAINCLKKYSKYFDNLSCDLMLGIPYQTKGDITYFIDRVAEYIKHISVYMLEVPQNSKLKSMINSGLKVASEDELADLYIFTSNELKKYKFKQYEISNFSLPSYQSKHNLMYWSYMDYIGLGPTACSKIGNIRYANTNDFYYKKEFQELSKNEMENEFIMLSLRLSTGLNLEIFKEIFGANFLDKYSNKLKPIEQYFDVDNSFIKIKSEYLIFENSLLVELLDF
jgi:oxygen-independent coproporphyrinogen-3 oxidase